MIFDNGSAGRLPYPVAKVTETVNNLIINGETYDKKTLSKVTHTIVDQGYNNMDKFKNFFNTTSVTHASNSEFCPSSYIQAISRTFVLDNLNPLMSILDNRNGNIEWTIAGDTVLKFDTSSKAYTIYRSTLLSTLCFSGGTILYQDDNYIYFLAENIQDGINYTYHAGYVLDKGSGKITVVSTVDRLNGSYVNKINILENKDGVIIVQNLNMGTHSLYKLVCASGKIEMTQISLPVSYDIGGYCNNMASKLDRNSYSYYLTITDNKLTCVKIIDGVLTGDTIQEVITNSEKIKVDDFLKKKYSLDSIDASVREKYLKFVNSAVPTAEGSRSGYRQIQCSIAGDNEEYLVINTATDIDSVDNKTKVGDEQTCFIAVFKRNNPDTDPMDLTLVEYIKYDEFKFPHGYPKCVFKFDNKKYFMSNSFGHMELVLNNENGKLDINIYTNPNLITCGYDSYGRLLTLNSSNQYLEVFNEKVPNYIDITYKNPGDCYIEFDGLAQTKQIGVEVKNIFNKPVEASFELKLEGSAEFSGSSSKIFRGKTSPEGKADVSVKILNPSKIVIGKRILHNNELSYGE